MSPTRARKLKLMLTIALDLCCATKITSLATFTQGFFSSLPSPVVPPSFQMLLALALQKYHGLSFAFTITLGILDCGYDAIVPDMFNGRFNLGGYFGIGLRL